MEYLGYYMKHGDQLKALFSSTGGNNHIALDLLNALAPVIARHFPALNDNDLLPDTVALLRAMLTPA